MHTLPSESFTAKGRKPCAHSPLFHLLQTHTHSSLGSQTVRGEKHQNTTHTQTTQFLSLWQKKRSVSIHTGNDAVRDLPSMLASSSHCTSVRERNSLAHGSWIPWAYYPKVVMTNEIVRLHSTFLTTVKIYSSPFDYPYISFLSWLVTKCFDCC